MAQHARLKIDAGIQVYFCDPHSPWQRGTNENTNGLLREYFPKGTDISMYSADEIAAVAAALNSRPRKTLAWKTPAEALDQSLISAMSSDVRNCLRTGCYRMSPVRTQDPGRIPWWDQRTIPRRRPASGRTPRAGLVQDADCGTGAQRRLVLDETEHGAMLVQVGPPAPSETARPNGVRPVIPGDGKKSSRSLAEYRHSPNASCSAISRLRWALGQRCSRPRPRSRWAIAPRLAKCAAACGPVAGKPPTRGRKSLQRAAVTRGKCLKRSMAFRRRVSVPVR
jgi:hypothetical protein